VDTLGEEMKNLNNLFKFIGPALLVGYALYSFLNNVLFFMRAQVKTVDVVQATQFAGAGRGGHNYWKLSTDFINPTDGKPITATVNTGSYYSGQKIKVFYDPANNQNIKVYDIEYFLDPWILIIVGILFACGIKFKASNEKKIKKRNY
jgi:hypothetical protein